MLTCIKDIAGFAYFWAENSEVKGSISNLQFGESVFCFGPNLEQLADKRQVIPKTLNYSVRSTGGIRVSGTIVNGFNFTLSSCVNFLYQKIKENQKSPISQATFF